MRWDHGWGERAWTMGKLGSSLGDPWFDFRKACWFCWLQEVGSLDFMSRPSGSKRFVPFFNCYRCSNSNFGEPLGNKALNLFSRICWDELDFSLPAARPMMAHFGGGRCMDLLDKILEFLDSPKCNKELSGGPNLLHPACCCKDGAARSTSTAWTLRLQQTWNNLVFGTNKDGWS